jgi:Putative prokaryotic signal transducing protein
MKTVVTLAETTDAHLVRARLESFGIVAHVLDENAASFASFAMGGVRVEVADEDYEAAMAFLLSEEKRTNAPAVES